jgi:radical SAM superfamily enzyme YgiQ (UPF0313 family)
MHPLLEDIEGIKPYTIFLKNCETNMFNYPTDKEKELFVKTIIDLNPTIVGFSVLSPFVPIARQLTKLIKGNCASLVIWGGVHPTISPEDCINEVDVLCMGEGEGAVAELAIHLRDRKPYQSIKNLWVRDGNNIIKNPMRPLRQDLDSLPFPSYGNDSYYFIDSNKITKKDPLLSDNYFWVQASRGCPYTCSYCVNSILRPLFKELGHYTRRRSVDNIVNEIKTNLSLYRNVYDYVFFVDEVFGTEESWLNEFELKYKKEVGLPFYVEYNPKIINSMMLSKLVNAGLNTINFGIQTGSDDIRNKIFHRPGKNNEIFNLIKEITKFSVKIKYDLIIDNPYDTEDSLKNTIDFLLQLPKPLFFNLYSLQYFPGYPLTKKAIEDKYIRPEDANVDYLLERTAKSWAFVPRLFPFTKKQVFQNVIWLIVWNHAKENIVKYSVFGDSFFSKLCLAYLNLKAVVLGKILGVGGITWQHRWVSNLIKGIKHMLRSDWGKLFLKIRRCLLIKGH